MTMAQIHRLPDAPAADDRRLIDVTVGELRRLIAAEVERATGQRTPAELFTPEQAGKALGVAGETVRGWARDRGCPCVRAGKQYRFRLPDVIAWLEETRGA